LRLFTTYLPPTYLPPTYYHSLICIGILSRKQAQQRNKLPKLNACQGLRRILERNTTAPAAQHGKTLQIPIAIVNPCSAIDSPDNRGP